MVNTVYKKKSLVDYLHQQNLLVKIVLISLKRYKPFLNIEERNSTEKTPPPVGSSIGVGNIRAR